MILINTCAEKLSTFEFVRPVADILTKKGIKFNIIDYKLINYKRLIKTDKIIICGTSLKDNDYQKNLDKFNWIKKIKIPVFGVCSGMQIIALLFGGKLVKETKIGVFWHKNKNFKFQAYELHNYAVSLPRNFQILAKRGKTATAFKYKNFSGVLFHPEVRNKEVIEKWIENENWL